MPNDWGEQWRSNETYLRTRAMLDARFAEPPPALNNAGGSFWCAAMLLASVFFLGVTVGAML